MFEVTEGMKDFDQLVQDALKPFQSSKGEQGSYTTTYFDDYETGGDESLHKEWRFAKPKPTSKTVVTSLAKMVKTHITTLTKEECDSLVYLSQNVDKLKKRVDTESETNARYLHVYSKLVAILGCVFENNIESYGYYLHDASGKFLLSSHFLFEHVHALLRVVAHYTQASTSASRYGLAADALREILVLCEEALEDGESSKMRYIVAPNSISNTCDTATTTTRERCITPKDFIRVILGGLGAIRARIHFCEAKRNECLFRESNEETRYAALVCREYTLAHQESEKKSKFWHHTRFMAHFWLCRSHFLIASKESSFFLGALTEGVETEEECNEARKTLARLLYVLDEVNRVEKDAQDTLALLDSLFVREYNALVNEISLLTKAIDTEIYDKRRMKEQVGISFALESLSNDDDDDDDKALSDGLKGVRQEAFRKYIEIHPHIEKPLALIRRIYESRRLGHHTLITPVQDDETTTVRVEHLDNNARHAILEERAILLNWLISQYSLSDGEFVLSSDLYPHLVTALREVEETQKEFSK